MPRSKNYIHRLQDELADSESKLTAVLSELSHLRKSLDGPKYTGIDSDGGRKDWMATADVALYIERLRVAATWTEPEPEPAPAQPFITSGMHGPGEY
jgi:hypothetical protein